MAGPRNNWWGGVGSEMCAKTPLRTLDALNIKFHRQRSKLVPSFLASGFIPPTLRHSHPARAFANTREIHIPEVVGSLPTLYEDEAGAFAHHILQFFHDVHYRK